MQRLFKAGLVLWAVLSLAVLYGAAGASATTVSIRPAERISALGNLSVAWYSGGSIAGEAVCRITLRGRLSSEFSELEGATVGRIGAVRAAGCTGRMSASVASLIERGEAREEEGNEFRPWLITYESVNSIFPTHASVRLEEWAMLFVTLEGSCGYTGRLSATLPLAYLEESRNPWEFTIGSLRVAEPVLISGARLLRGFFCMEVKVTGLEFTLEPGQRWVRGITGPILRPRSIEFGRIDSEGVAKKKITFAVTAATRVRSIAVGTGVTFAVTDPQGCRGATVPAGGSCTFTVLFVPPGSRERGAGYIDGVVIETDAGNTSVSLRGTTN
jgi:hypothetical protein